uniref:Uncharacterized protein n=1 Tax=Rhizophora mucronata TaxID=61149 RepID=A0A2P2PGV6_RHIMU
MSFKATIFLPPAHWGKDSRTGTYVLQNIYMEHRQV